MKAQDLIRDPVFQLNLLLWMAKEQPKEAFVVKPVFFEAGFRLVYIEQPFPFPPETIQAIQKSDLDIGGQPEPDMLLGRSSDQRALYFEAKAESFSAGSSTAKQARGHLLAAGQPFAEVMAPLESCLLCYVLPEESRALMTECLKELSEAMAGEGLAIGDYSTHGLSVQDRDLLYSWDEAYQEHAKVSGKSAVVLANLEEDTDPSPLFLVYSAEDYPDPENQDLLRRCMVSQVHALLLCRLNAMAPASAYQCSAESILEELSGGVYQYLGRKRQKAMRGLVRNNVFRRIADYSKERFADVVSYERGALTFRFPDRDRKSAFLDWFEDVRRTAFSSATPPSRRYPLFPDMEDEAD